uniref:Protein YAE1 n=1 Tax=Mycena chlorophos TaxID=658473 RepID=A0ABQ0MAQ1_MYCCL|nr:predicted protein [Mycena chlorophos]
MESPWDDDATAQHSSDAEWSKIASEFTNAGYREGITAGKESALQEGFDAGFAQVGVPLGREIGHLRGAVSAIVAFLQSPHCQRDDKTALLAEARSIAVSLADIRFSDIAPRDLEAEAHAREHLALDDDEGVDENPELKEKREMEALEDMLGKLTPGTANTGIVESTRPTMIDVQTLAQRVELLSVEKERIRSRPASRRYAFSRVLRVQRQAFNISEGMPMEASTQTDAVFFSSGTVALTANVLNTVNAGTKTLRRLIAAATKPHQDPAQQEDNASEAASPSRWSEADSESSDESATPEPTPRAIHPSLFYWNRPRRKLLDLPLEIIEHIALSLREPRCLNQMDEAALYISDRYHAFSEARHPLSALTRTCWTLRNALERILYRNIQLDMTGWKGRKHTGWPAGSLRLLLRTLEARPDLARFIHVAAIDYPLTSDAADLEDGLKRFLAATPYLKFICLAQCPLAFWDHRIWHLKGFATAFAPGILPSVLEDLTSLDEVHLRDSQVMSLNGSLPGHNIRRVRMDSSHENAALYFARLLTIFRSTLVDLDVRFIGGLQQRVPLFLNLGNAAYLHSGGHNLRYLRLDNVSVLSHLESGYAFTLRGLPALETLHVTHHAPFAPAAFSMLPPSLSILTASQYYGLWASERVKEGFPAAFGQAISMSTREILRVEGSGVVLEQPPSSSPRKRKKSGSEEEEEKEKEKKERERKLDIRPVVEACKLEGILCDEVMDAAGPFLRVFFGRRPIGPEYFVKAVKDTETEEDEEN